MSKHRLEDSPENTWGNTILFRLAEVLGYPAQPTGDVTSPVRHIIADPDDVLEEALETIWKYRDLNDE